MPDDATDVGEEQRAGGSPPPLPPLPSPQQLPPLPSLPERSPGGGVVAADGALRDTEPLVGDDEGGEAKFGVVVQRGRPSHAAAGAGARVARRRAARAAAAAASPHYYCAHLCGRRAGSDGGGGGGSSGAKGALTCPRYVLVELAARVVASWGRRAAIYLVALAASAAQVALFGVELADSKQAAPTCVAARGTLFG
eukprot:COSAG01_NODE_1803_length_9197_cov_11.062321_7_plen_196_part_00